MTEKSKKYIIFSMKIFLVLSTVAFPFLTVIMTGAGLVYNYISYGRKIMYTGIFFILSGLLMTAGSILNMFNKKIFNIVSALLWCAGFILCMTMLYRLCLHADYNGWSRNLQPVSSMYKSRIMPVAVPFVLDMTLSVIQYRKK